MATIKIEPINLKSIKNLTVIISGLAPTDKNCYIGKITAADGSIIDARWNLDGLISNQNESGNLDINQVEMIELSDLAKLLGVGS